MSHEQTMRVIACCGIHDEMESTAPFSLAHCAMNIICSHGNKFLVAAIERGVLQGALTPERASAMKSVLDSTRAELLLHVDRLSVLKRIYRIGSGDQQDSIGGKITEILGVNRSEWDKAHTQLQLSLAEPIIQIARILARLGLLDVKPGITHIDTSKMLATQKSQNSKMPSS